MVLSAEQLAHTLQGTSLANRQIETLAVPNASEDALFVACAADEVRQLWLDAVGMVPATRRYPIATYAVAGIESTLLHDSVPPRSIASTAEALDLGELWDRMMHRVDWFFNREPAEHLWATVATQVSYTNRLLGTDLAADVALAGLGPSRTMAEIEQWLMSWELAHGDPRSSSVLRQVGGTAAFDPGGNAGFPFYLCFLPTEHSWHAPAYLQYWGAENRVAEFCAAVRDWESRFGARLMTLGAVQADFQVAHPPKSDAAAWKLAAELACFGRPPELPWRWLVMALESASEWHAWDRP